MKPIKFEEMNCTYAENQPEYLPLPAYKADNGESDEELEGKFIDKLKENVDLETGGITTIWIRKELRID